jgi:uncharacterized alkaline shock family protein YloU
MPKTPAVQPLQRTQHRGKIEVLPNAIHTIAVQAITESYGVVGITAPRLRNGHAVFLPQDRLNQGVQIRVVDNQITVEVYVALEYGLRISEIAHNIMSAVKFSIEKMIGVPVTQVNVNVQGLSQDSNK